MTEVHRCQVEVEGVRCGREIRPHQVACREHWCAGSPGLQRGFLRLEASERREAITRQGRGDRDPWSHYRREMSLWRLEWAEKLAGRE